MHLHPYHGCRLHQAFRFRGQPVQARCQHGVYRLRHHPRSVPPALFHSMPRQLLQKERL